MTTPPLTRRTVLAKAAPIMAANATTPLTGLVDIAVIGNTGAAADLAAVALGSLVFNTLFFAFGFLRMGSTALTAQADGAGREDEVRAALVRAGLLGAAIGGALLLLSGPLRAGAFALFSGGPEVEGLGAAYVEARLWGAPAALAGVAVYGWLIGLGRTGWALALQAALNLANIALSIAFVVGLDMGVAGVGLASAAAQWLHLALAVLAARLILANRGPGVIGRVFEPAAVARLISVNRDIFLRTLALLAGFAWFNEASLREGADVLAGNAVLLQFISISAYVLDGFAYVTESLVGQAAGRRSWRGVKRALRLASEQAALAGLVLSLALFGFGEAMIRALTDDPAARAAAIAFLPWCALAPLIGMPSWQLDGLMIGATRGPLMRNAMLASLAIYLALDAGLRSAAGLDLGGTGLWLAFLLYYAARALTLATGLPGLPRAVRSGEAAPG